MKIIFFITYLFFFIVLEYFLLKVNIKEMTPLKNRNGDSPLKRFGPDYTCANTDYFIAQF